MATTQVMYTSREAAKILGVSDGYVRRICGENDEIGSKHGHVWLLTDADIERIRNTPEFGTGPRYQGK